MPRASVMPRVSSAEFRAHRLARQRRVLLANRALDIGEPHGRDDERAGSGQQFVEQYAQHVDVARGGDGLPADLLGTRVIRRHQPKIRLRDGQRVMSRLAFVQQFGDAEVEQFGHAIGRDQDVRGLEVAMHDEILMRVMHCGTNRLKKLEPGYDVQAVRVAVGIDGDAVDILHDDVGGPVREGATVHEMRDVRVIELRQDLPLDFDPRMDSAGERAAEDHFDGDLLLELRIGTFGKVNLAHAADTQGAQHAIRSDSVAFHGSKHAPRRGWTANTGHPCGEVLLACMKVRQECKAGVDHMTNGNEPIKPQPSRDPEAAQALGREPGRGQEQAQEPALNGHRAHRHGNPDGGNDQPPQTKLR